VTQPAVSRAIGNLEEHLGVKLFRRRGRWVEMTPSGELLFHVTAAAFSTMTNALYELDSTANRRETISLSFSTATATHWMLPRLSKFRTAFPDAELVFQLFGGEATGSMQDFDLGLRLANPQEGDLHRWPFCDETIMALCSSEYLDEHGPIGGSAKNTRHTLIRLSGQHYTWDNFFNASGQVPARGLASLAFSDYSSVLQAAAGGHGLALGWMSAASRLVIDGALVPANPHVIKTGRRYHLVASNRRPVRPIVADVRDWLIEEMRNDLNFIAAMS